MSGVLVLSHDDVQQALDPGECAEAMAAVLASLARGEAYMPLRSVMIPPSAPGFFGMMPAWRGTDKAAFGLKAVCVMPGNPARGLDSHQGIVTLFDNDTGVPTAIVEASAITSIRTAAVTAVATRTLAREDARTLAILGAGAQARAHLNALQEKFEQIRVYSPRPEHAQALAARSAHATTTASAEEAVREADVVVTATSSREPVLAREWLTSGAHVNAVGASMPAARELDVDTVAAAALFCDSRESISNEAGEFQLAIRENAIGGLDHVRGTLGEVLAGTAPGRTNNNELTVFRSLGLAVEDLAAAQLAVQRAREQSIGTEVTL